MTSINPIISVIIPCYGAHMFLEQLLESINSQTFKDAEWIIVNDGDATQNEKLEQMQKDNSSIRVVWKENGGASSARNVGIKEAKGDWIVFVDADDRLKPHYLQSLFDSVNGTDAEMGIAGFDICRIRENSITDASLHFKEDCLKALPLKEAFDFIKEDPYARDVPWNKIFKASLFREYNILYELGIKVVQDAILNLEFYNRIEKISLIKNCGYIYVLNDSASLSSTYDPGYIRDTERMQSEYLKLYRKIGFSEDVIHRIQVDWEGIKCLFLVYNLFRRKSPVTLRQAKEIVKKELFDNSQLMNSYQEWKKQPRKKVERVFCWCVDTKSPWLVVLVVKSMHVLKYNFMGVYFKLKPYLFT